MTMDHVVQRLMSDFAGNIAYKTKINDESMTKVIYFETNISSETLNISVAVSK